MSGHAPKRDVTIREYPHGVPGLLYYNEGSYFLIEHALGCGPDVLAGRCCGHDPATEPSNRHGYLLCGTLPEWRTS
jgi:hypothetical protein